MPTDRQKQLPFACAAADAASYSAAGVAGEAMDVVQTEAPATPGNAEVSSVLSPPIAGYVQQGAAPDGARKAPARSCVVCSDRAQGFNFNAVTCQSCKAFFRRTAVKALELKCAMSGDCHLDVHTRRFCPSCRLRKCYATGMKRELILDDEEKARRKEKVLRNREEKLRALKEVHCTVPVAASSPAATLSAATRRSNNGQHACHTAAGDKATSVATLLPIGDRSAADGSELFRRSCPAAAAAAEAAAVGQLPYDAASAVVGGGRSAAGAVADQSSSSQPGGQSYCSEEGIEQVGGGGGSDSRSCGQQQRTVCVVHPFSSSSSSSSALRPVAAPLAEPGAVLPSPRSRVVDLTPQLSLPRELPLRRTLADREVAELTMLGSNFLHAFCVSRDDSCRGPSLDSYRDSRRRFYAQRAKFLLRGLHDFTSTLPDFTGLPRGTQVSLLRSAATSCMLLRSAQLYDPSADLWDDGHGTVFRQTELNLAFVGEADIFSHSAALARSFKKLFPELPATVSAETSIAVAPTGAGGSTRRPTGGDDSTLYALLHAITVLSPEHAASKAEDTAATAEGCRDVFGDVSDAQQHYATLLRRHLEATYSFACAADLLPSMLQRLCMYKCFAQQARRVLTALEPFEPLLRGLPR